MAQSSTGAFGVQASLKSILGLLITSDEKSCWFFGAHSPCRNTFNLDRMRSALARKGSLVIRAPGAGVGLASRYSVNPIVSCVHRQQCMVEGLCVLKIYSFLLRYGCCGQEMDVKDQYARFSVEVG